LTAALREARQQNLKPPPKLTVSEWADAYRRLSPEASAEPGRWMTARAEYQRGIMNAVSDPAIEAVVVMSSAQVGKTEIVNNIVGFHIHQDPAPILLLQPTLEMAMAWSKDRLAPMLRDTPALKNKVKDPRARDSGNTLLHKSFAGGHITMAGANSPASLASRPIRVVLCDEVDRYPVSAGSEGDPVNLARKRTATFWNKKLVLVSTPTVKGASRIETAWLESDQRRYFVPCPHCGHHQTLRWGQVFWDEGKPETAHYCCESCGTLWTDAERYAAIRWGEWRATAPFRGTAGFHLNELYSSWSRVAAIAKAFLEAKRGGSETLKTWVNTSLGETWEEAGEKADGDALLARRENYGPDSLPAEALVVSAGIDTQDDRLEVEIVGWRAEDRDKPEQSWGVEHLVLYGDPAQDEVWQRLDECLLKTYRTQDGRALRVLAACIDAGGHHAAAVYRFCEKRAGRHVYATIGREGRRPIWPKRSGKSRKHKSTVWTVGVDTAKDAVYSRLKIKEPGPGYCHFPAAYDEPWFKQLTVEKVVTKYVKGHPTRVWTKPNGARNEALDCRVLALAALHSRQVNWKALVKRIAVAPTAVEETEPVEPPAEPIPVEQVIQNKRKQRRPVKRGYASAWKPF
jgi:phage terminase large subunit GpA-like protein